MNCKASILIYVFLISVLLIIIACGFLLHKLSAKKENENYLKCMKLTIENVSWCDCYGVVEESLDVRECM